MLSKKSVKSEYIVFLFLVALGIFLIAGGGYVNATKKGLLLWAGTVLPSLFPYAFISACLSRLKVTSLASRKLNGVTKRLFNTGGASATAFLLSLIAGYPMGAKTVAELKNKNLLNNDESVRASAFCSTSSPMFLMSVGCITFNSKVFGYLLIISHFLSAILTGILFSFYKKSRKPSDTLPTVNTVDNVFFESVFSSINSMLFVGATITLFSVLIEMLCSLNLLTLPTYLFDFILGKDTGFSVSVGLLECTSGLKELSANGASAKTLALSGFLCGFGGLCIIMQSTAYLKSAKIKTAPFYLAKVIQAVINFLICLCLGYLFL